MCLLNRSRPSDDERVASVTKERERVREIERGERDRERDIESETERESVIKHTREFSHE